METDFDVKIDEKISINTITPKSYNVVVFNDDYTPIEWVIALLTRIFRHSESTAEQLTLSIHNDGSAVVGTYDYEIAEQKTIESVELSRSHGFPLEITVKEA
jgi:ATP-dependent Clp protease adaptor protein ClpS